MNAKGILNIKIIIDQEVTETKKLKTITVLSLNIFKLSAFYHLA